MPTGNFVSKTQACTIIEPCLKCSFNCLNYVKFKLYLYTFVTELSYMNFFTFKRVGDVLLKTAV